MLKAYLICGIVPLLGFMLAMNGDLVLTTVMLSFGLMLPVWHLLVNLWWVWLLFLPIVIAAQSDRPLSGVVATGFAAVLGYWGLGVWSEAGVARAVAAFTPPSTVTQSQPLALTPARSAELVTTDATLLENGPCGTICFGLFGGGLDWLRVIDQSDARQPQTWTFRRAERADCMAVDAEFRPGTTCILAASNTTEAAALQIAYLQVNGEGRDDGAFASLISGMRLQVSAAGAVLHDVTARHWSEVSVPLRMTVDIQFVGQGNKGAALARVDRKDPAPDLQAVLAGLGQPMAPPAATDQRSTTALILSMLRSGPYGLAPATQRQMETWLENRRTRTRVGAAEREVLRGLQQRGLHSATLSRLMVASPDMFGNGLPDLFRTATTGSEDSARNAARALHEIVMRDPPGTHAAHEAAYLDLLRSGRNWPTVVQMAGRFTFDPAPVLQAELEARTTSTSEVFGQLMRAACLAGPKWDATLAPVVQGWLRPMQLRRFWQVYPGTEIEYFMSDVGPTGAAALRRMGRADLLQDIMAQADWDAAMQDMQRTREVPVTQEMAEREFFGWPERASNC